MPPVEAPVRIAYDGAEPARRCIDEAARLLGSRRVVVMTAWEPGLARASAMPMSSLGGLSTPAVDLGAAREAEEAMQERAERIAGDGAELARSAGLEAEAVAVGQAVAAPDAIVGKAREIGAAAIVIGSRGLSGLRARMQGSTSSALLKDAPCPVLVVHDD
jgi:nucleotide-binding universal stress UspA family protein